MAVKGIDISRYQANLDFQTAVNAGVKFVIIRAGVGTGKDSYMDNHVAECRRLKIPYGFYWYFMATTHDQFVAELRACVSVLGNEMPQYPVFFDMEEQSQISALTTDERTDMAIRFCQEMTKAGLPSGIYTNPSWMENYFDKQRLLDGKYDIWLAHWTNSPDVASKYNYGQTMWQWGVDKIDNMDVDGDLCFIDYPAKIAKWYSDNGIDKSTVVEPAEKPSDVPASTIKVGDTVTVKSGAKFTNGVTPFSFVYTTEFTVLSLSNDHKEALIGIDGQATGWMYVCDLEIVSAKSASECKFQLGDTVKVKSGAVYVNGVKPYDWVYSTEFELLMVSVDNVTGLIGLEGQATGWFKLTDLYSVKSVSGAPSTHFQKGDKVKVKSGATTYAGTKLSSFVYSNTYVVMQVGKQGAQDYIVIGDGKNITAAVKAADLTVVK